MGVCPWWKMYWHVCSRFGILFPFKISFPEYSFQNLVSGIFISKMGFCFRLTNQYGVERWMVLALHLEWVLTGEHKSEVLASVRGGGSSSNPEDILIAYVVEHKIEEHLLERPLQFGKRLANLLFTGVNGKHHVLLVAVCRMFDGAMRREIAERPENKKRRDCFHFLLLYSSMFSISYTTVQHTQF